MHKLVLVDNLGSEILCESEVEIYLCSDDAQW